MSKIASYGLADSPLQLSDRLIGTEAPRPQPTTTPAAWVKIYNNDNSSFYFMPVYQ